MMPHDLPPWEAVYQQTQRWLYAGVFEAIVGAALFVGPIGEASSRTSAVILDSRTLQSTPESGGRAGYYGAKRKRGNKVHIAVETLGHLLALVVTSANEQERSPVQELAQPVQQITQESVDVAFADQGYTGEQAAQKAIE